MYVCTVYTCTLFFNSEGFLIFTSHLQFRDEVQEYNVAVCM